MYVYPNDKTRTQQIVEIPYNLAAGNKVFDWSNLDKMELGI